LARAPASRAEEAPPSPVVGGNECLLVAEDEPVVRTMLARSLRGYGYTVLEARDGDQALALIAQQATPPDLIVVDVVMPGIGAKEISAEIARRWPSLPILFTSGYTGIDAAARGLLDESRDFLQKPLDPEALARKVRQMLDARAGRIDGAPRPNNPVAGGA
jgi:CheY-like chemotaxis protein